MSVSSFQGAAALPGLCQGGPPCATSACGMPSIIASLGAEMVVYERVTSCRLWLRTLVARALTRGCDAGDQEGRARTCHTPYHRNSKMLIITCLCMLLPYCQIITKQNGWCQVQSQQGPIQHMCAGLSGKACGRNVPDSPCSTSSARGVERQPAPHPAPLLCDHMVMIHRQCHVINTLTGLGMHVFWHTWAFRWSGILFHRKRASDLQ